METTTHGLRWAMLEYSIFTIQLVLECFFTPIILYLVVKTLIAGLYWCYWWHTHRCEGDQWGCRHIPGQKTYNHSKCNVCGGSRSELHLCICWLGGKCARLPNLYYVCKWSNATIPNTKRGYCAMNWYLWVLYVIPCPLLCGTYLLQTNFHVVQDSFT
jgi:hypothetical protein